MKTGARSRRANPLANILAGLWLAGAAAAGSGAAEKPNLVLLYADNLGYGDLACYGNRDILSPRIDRLAAEGVRCTDFSVASPGCTPSRGAILTGRYPARNGLARQLVVSENWHGIGLPQRERILPQYLKAAGYATACVGKWNIGFAEGSRPTDRGFDEFFGCRSGNIHYFKHTYHGEYDLFRGTEPHRVEGYSTELFAEAACDFIRRKRNGPFFLYLPFNAPHYVSEANTEPGSGEKPEWHVPGAYLERYGRSAAGATERHRYLALVTAMDDAVGRILDTLDEAGLRERTLVVFLSDMGAILRPGRGLGVASNAPFRDGAPSVYEGGVRVPAIIRWPGRIEAGSECGASLSQLDLLPLFLAAAGIEPPPDRVLDGRNPLPALRGEAPPPPPRRLVFTYGKSAALREGIWKIVRQAPNRPWELYDLAADPGESTDLADAKSEIVSRLEASFREWETEVKRDASPPAPWSKPAEL